MAGGCLALEEAISKILLTNDIISTFKREDGWGKGAFTRTQADGAIPNGTRVIKVNASAYDPHQDGDKATVIGSFATGGAIGYFVEWDDMLRAACLVADYRLKVLQ
jgi:hypothetical protein